MYQLILVITTYWEAFGQQVIGGVTSQVITGDDREALVEKGVQAEAQFKTQGVTIGWTVV